MHATPLTDIPDLWRKLLIDLAFARNYRVGFIDLPGPVPKNPVLEQLLPSLLHIKTVAILDHALKSWIDANGMRVPKRPYGTELKGRIDFLADNNKIRDRATLHGLRTVKTTWHRALAHYHLEGSRPGCRND